MAWYSHLFKNFPQFVVIHTVKGFGIVNKAEIDVFLELSCFFNDPADIGNLISGSSAFSKTSLNIWTISMEKKCNKAKWLSEEALEIAVKRGEVKKQRRKGKIQVSECRVPKNSKKR